MKNRDILSREATPAQRRTHWREKGCLSQVCLTGLAVDRDSERLARSSILTLLTSHEVNPEPRIWNEVSTAGAPGVKIEAVPEIAVRKPKENLSQEPEPLRGGFDQGVCVLDSRFIRIVSAIWNEMLHQ